MLYYNARYYDPVLARFVSADTIGIDRSNPQTRNRYAYVLNNPLRYNDPTGHCAENPKDNDACHAKADELATYGIIVDRAVWDIDMLVLLLEAISDWAKVSGWNKTDFQRAFQNVFITIEQRDSPGFCLSGRISIDIDLITNVRNGKASELWFKQVMVHELAHRWDDVSADRSHHQSLSSELVSATKGTSVLACWGYTRISSCDSIYYAPGDVYNAASKYVDNQFEDYAESVVATIYGTTGHPSQPGKFAGSCRNRLVQNQFSEWKKQSGKQSGC